MMAELLEFALYHDDAVAGIAKLLHTQFESRNLRFVGVSPAEFQELLAARVNETEFRSCLALLALIEAQLRVDLRIRVATRKKDPLSKEIRKRRKSLGEKIRFDDLLKLWATFYPESRRIVAELRAAFHLRHWLAHGRYLRKPTGKLDYTSIYDLV